jgi:hypothetical protein
MKPALQIPHQRLTEGSLKSKQALLVEESIGDGVWRGLVAIVEW